MVASGRGARRRVAAARSIRRHRTGGPSGADVVSLVYATLLVTALVVAVLVRALAVGVFTPEAAAVLRGDGVASVLALAAGAVLAAAPLVGAVRGPALCRPFAAWALAGSDLPMRRTLATPTVPSVLAVAAICAAAGLVPALAAGLGAGAVGVGAGCAALGLAAGALWLLGQLLRPAAALGVALACALVSLAAVVPALAWAAPGAWLATLWRAALGASAPPAGAVVGGPWVAAAAALAVLAAAALAALPLLLDRLSPPDVLAAARRWESAGMLGATGDLGGAFGLFRVYPTRGRRMPAAPSRRLAFVRRDLVGALRSPGRFVAGVCGMLAAGALLAAGAGLPSWPLAAVGGAAGFVAAGVWCDGLRHAADAAGRPALYGVGTAALALRHALAPTVCALAFGTLGAVPAAAGLGLPAWTLGFAAASAVLLVCVRAYDAARPPLPVTLLTPVPTPAGDVSVLVVALWQADALLAAALAPGLVAALAPGAAATAWLAAPALVVALGAARRLRSLA